MRFRISHKTRFEYAASAYDSHNEVKLRPWDSATQRCVAFTIETEPPAAVLPYDDFFGNHAHALSVSDPHRALSIIAASTVEIELPEPINYPAVSFSTFLAGDIARGKDFYEFLGASRYVPFSERLRKFFWMGARPGGAEDVAAYAMRVVAYVRDQFEYETTTTNAYSSVNDILKSGGGVCQDFAHLTIGILRLAGVPARYVSGYLAPAQQTPGSGWVGEQATHAWLEAWLPGPGWVGFDPTHRCRTDERHLGIAIGRDYSDVPPIRGSYRKGGAKSLMRIDLRIEQAAAASPLDEATSAEPLQSQQ